jgi:ribosomal protein S18 acetylase RimI-like enzyme
MRCRGGIVRRPIVVVRRMTDSHPLDFPIWTALTTRQQALAQVCGGARRYPPDIAPFAALADETAQSWDALHALLAPGEPAVLFTPGPVSPPAQFDVVMAATGEQMIGTPAQTDIETAPLVALGADDVPAMMELVELTRPGPFAPRTSELGDFLGIRIGGRLAAMTGERMAPADYTEMTAVCVHPDFRGRGFAQVLLAAVSRRILARGEIPFLHVFSDNASAIALYKRQGMTIRRQLHVTVLGRQGTVADLQVHARH